MENKLTYLGTDSMTQASVGHASNIDHAIANDFDGQMQTFDLVVASWIPAPDQSHVDRPSPSHNKPKFFGISPWSLFSV